MAFADPVDWTIPIPIHYGPGRLREGAALCRAHGIAHPLIVTDVGSAALPFMDALRRDLRAAQIPCETFADISPNPRDTEISTARTHFREGGHDGIIAIGGGSAMDAGKAVALTARTSTPLFDFEFEKPAPPVPEGFAPLITIPTTAGTGAETESTAMITDTAQAMKWCVWHPRLKPSAALLDPELTCALPPHLTAWTGIDALVHAIESYTVPANHPLCDGAALQAMGLIAQALPVAYRTPGDIEARGAMLIGACLAGMSFVKGLGLVHALSHMIGAEYDTQHGLTNAILLPAVLDFNAPAIAPRIPAMAAAMGLPGTDFAAFRAAICALLDDLEIPKGLADIGVPDDGLDRLAQKALQDSAAGTNPRSATAADLVALLQGVLQSAR